MKRYYEPLDTCPKCGSIEIEEVDTFSENETLYQQIVCNTCEHSWYEVWTFSHSEEA